MDLLFLSFSLYEHPKGTSSATAPSILLIHQSSASLQVRKSAIGGSDHIIKLSILSGIVLAEFLCSKMTTFELKSTGNSISLDETAGPAVKRFFFHVVLK